MQPEMVSQIIKNTVSHKSTIKRVIKMCNSRLCVLLWQWEWTGRKEPHELDSSATSITTVTLVEGGAMQGYENIGRPWRNDRAGRGRKANGIGSWWSTPTSTANGVSQQGGNRKKNEHSSHKLAVTATLMMGTNNEWNVKHSQQAWMGHHRSTVNVVKRRRGIDEYTRGSIDPTLTACHLKAADVCEHTWRLLW
jgi:hypothetical protein